jgi:REP-associated tyrosine transposase
MPDTYTQLRYHLVFSTKHRVPLITAAVRDKLYDYMGGVLRANGGILLAMGGMPDHVHLLAGWGTTLPVARIMKLLKGISSRWMNERVDRPAGGFAWQEGYGAFSVSASKVPAVRNYILTQEEHHRKVSFQEEYMNLLKKHGMDFNPRDFAN